MRTLWHDIDLYKCTLMVTDNPKQFMEDLDYDEGEWLESPVVSGLCLDKRWFGICFNPEAIEEQRKRGLDGVIVMAWLAHETAHTAAHILDSVGAMPRHNQDMEPFCYLQEYLMRVCLKHLGYR